jgi:hypothetical protein
MTVQLKELLILFLITFQLMNKAIKIVTLSNEFEARLLDGLLNEKGIPHLLRSYHDSAYDGLWQTDSRWGHLEAPVEFKEEILKIFNEMSSGHEPIQ